MDKRKLAKLLRDCATDSVCRMMSRACSDPECSANRAMLAATELEDEARADEDAAEDRLEYLRGELRAERISYGELHELQSLAKYIPAGDVELLEAAGVPERMGSKQTRGDKIACAIYDKGRAADMDSAPAWYSAAEAAAWAAGYAAALERAP